MSEKSQRETNNIREKSFNKMADIIDNCQEISKLLNLEYVEIPNIVITYNNKIVFLKQEFEKMGIDFYNSQNCESRFIIEFKLQSLITFAENYIASYLSVLSISKKQLDDFVDSYKKPSFFDKVFKSVKYAPKTSLLTPEQKHDAIYFFKKYIEYNNAIYSFSLKDNMNEAISFYRDFAIENGVSDKDFDTRVKKIHCELSLLGYDNF